MEPTAAARLVDELRSVEVVDWDSIDDGDEAQGMIGLGYTYDEDDDDDVESRGSNSPDYGSDEDGSDGERQRGASPAEASSRRRSLRARHLSYQPAERERA